MKQLRENFAPIRDALLNGEEYLLLYRSKPLAVLSPHKEGQIESKKNSSKGNVKPQKKRLLAKKRKARRKPRAEFSI